MLRSLREKGRSEKDYNEKEREEKMNGNKWKKMNRRILPLSALSPLPRWGGER
jgi:hypothetical protein